MRYDRGSRLEQPLPPEPARIPEPWPPPDEGDRPSPEPEPDSPRREDPEPDVPGRPTGNLGPFSWPAAAAA